LNRRRLLEADGRRRDRQIDALKHARHDRTASLS
jgi:hypothetical protein